VSLHNVTPGAKAPEEFNVIIEIPMNGDPIKYEVDEEERSAVRRPFHGHLDALPVQLRLHPAHLADDGDPVDVLVITPLPLITGVVVTCRAAGHAEDGRRGRRRQQAAGGADRQDPAALQALEKHDDI
jgi:inorganic pyrophosphatase